MNRLHLLRTKLNNHKVDAYIIPINDPHLSKFSQEYNKNIYWISKFTGSQGTAIITQTSAILFTDNIYIKRAKYELSNDWEVILQENDKSIIEWCEAFNGIIGFCSLFFSIDYVLKLKMNTDKFIQTPDLISLLCKKNNPQQKLYPVIFIKNSGQTYIDKLNKVREKLKDNKVDVIVISSPDEISLLFNIGIPDTHFKLCAYAVITQDKCNIYINKQTLNNDILKKFGKNNVEFYEYDRLFMDLDTINSETSMVVWLDPKFINYEIFERFNEDAKILRNSPIKLMMGV